ncbi:MAG: hypothetical protein NC131_11140 [Roseburia sp.]|nr:hypothetical protein [Roseburia sp.]
MKIEEVYRKYMFNVEWVRLDQIAFNGVVMIQDGYGWTELKSVKRVELVEPVQWVTLRAGSFFITVSDDELIPVYNPDATRPGFHGRVLYGYHLIPAKDIRIGSKVRLLPTATSGDQFQEIDDIGMKDVYMDHGYQLVTISGSYAGNGISMSAIDGPVESSRMMYN